MRAPLLVTAALLLSSGCDRALPDLGVAGYAPAVAPVGELLPEPGEVLIIHPGLGDGTLGDGTVIVGPDGSMALLDVGNDDHTGIFRALIARLNTELLTPARGYPVNREPLQVEHVVLTHFHADHVGGAGELLGGLEPLDIRGRIVFRGFVDTSNAYGRRGYRDFCIAATTLWADRLVALCRSDDGPAPCDESGDDLYPVDDCPGLLASDLEEVGDDDDGGLAWLSLGGGARLYIVAAAGHIADGTMVDLGWGSDDEENARSLAGVLVHGRFRYHFGGDMTGGGDGSPDLEGPLATAALELDDGDLPLDPVLYGPRGVDVFRAHHHGLANANSETLLDAFLPPDGGARNVVVSASNMHVTSTAPRIARRLADDGRLSGGGIWQTMNTAFGSSHPLLISADGSIRVRTLESGSGYWMQALVHDDPERAFSVPFPTVR